MSFNLMPTIKQHFDDKNGKPLSGGRVNTYLAGTNTPFNTYTDSTGSTVNGNPVILDMRGEADIWLADNISYKVVLEDRNGNEIYTVDNIVGGGGDGGGNIVMDLENAGEWNYTFAGFPPAIDDPEDITLAASEWVIWTPNGAPANVQFVIMNPVDKDGIDLSLYLDTITTSSIFHARDKNEPSSAFSTEISEATILNNGNYIFPQHSNNSLINDFTSLVGSTSSINFDAQNDYSNELDNKLDKVDTAPQSVASEVTLKEGIIMGNDKWIRPETPQENMYLTLGTNPSGLNTTVQMYKDTLILTAGDGTANVGSIAIDPNGFSAYDANGNYRFAGIKSGTPIKSIGIDGDDELVQYDYSDPSDKLDKIDTAPQSVESSVDFKGGVRVGSGFNGPGSQNILLEDDSSSYIWSKDESGLSIHKSFDDGATSDLDLENTRAKLTNRDGDLEGSISVGQSGDMGNVRLQASDYEGADATAVINLESGSDTQKTKMNFILESTLGGGTGEFDFSGGPLRIETADETPVKSLGLNSSNEVIETAYVDASGKLDSVQPGTNISIDNTDPLNPIINASGTTAGLTSKVYFTADLDPVNTTWYQLSDSGKGTATSAQQTLLLGPNTNADFTENYISGEYGFAGEVAGGDYEMQLVVEASNNNGNQRFTAAFDLYDADGISGHVPLATLDSGILDIQGNNPTQIKLTGSLPVSVPHSATQRVRVTITAYKVGGSNNTTLSVWSGSDYESFINVPVPITTDGVTDLSTVNPGGTLTESLNILNANSGGGTVNVDNWTELVAALAVPGENNIFCNNEVFTSSGTVVIDGAKRVYGANISSSVGQTITMNGDSVSFYNTNFQATGDTYNGSATIYARNVSASAGYSGAGSFTYEKLSGSFSGAVQSYWDNTYDAASAGQVFRIPLVKAGTFNSTYTTLSTHSSFAQGPLNVSPIFTGSVAGNIVGLQMAMESISANAMTMEVVAEQVPVDTAWSIGTGTEIGRVKIFDNATVTANNYSREITISPIAFSGNMNIFVYLYALGSYSIKDFELVTFSN